MKALLQRVRTAKVCIGDEVAGEIGAGLLVFLGVEKGDDAESLNKLVKKILGYRIFADDKGKMNLDIRQSGGSILVISQFTLAANTSQGLRPGFSGAADPELAKNFYQQCIALLQEEVERVESGRFAADMQVHLVNDGPVTFLLST